MSKVKCSKCNYVGEEEEFPKGRDMFQKLYIRGCPKCDNSQSPGDASMRMFGGIRPFIYLRNEEKSGTPLGKTLHSASEAS